MKSPTKLGALVAAVEEVARRNFDGHFSLFSFSTNFKGCYGTPRDMDGANRRVGNFEMRDDIHDLPAHASLEELLYFMAEHPESYVPPDRSTRFNHV